MVVMDEQRLTSIQAFLAMYAYLSEIYERTKSNDIGLILSDLSYLSDGNSADPAVADDWARAVHKALDGQVDARMRLG